MAITAARQSCANVASIIVANLEEVLGKTTLYARLKDNEYEAAVAMAVSPGLHGAADGAYLGFAIFNADGRLLSSSANRSAEPEMAALVHRLRREVDSLTGPDLVIGHAHTDVGKPWRIPMVIRVAVEGHQELRYFGAVVDLGYFLQRYRNIELDRDGRIDILHKEGESIAAFQHGGIAANGTAPRLATSRNTGMEEQVVKSDVRLSQYSLHVVVARSSREVVQPLEKPQVDYRNRLPFIRW